MAREAKLHANVANMLLRKFYEEGGEKRVLMHAETVVSGLDTEEILKVAKKEAQLSGDGGRLEYTEIQSPPA